MVTVAKSAECADAEAHLLALHVAAGLPAVWRLVHARTGEIAGCPRCSKPYDDGDAGDEQDRHRREERPALALVSPAILPERVREPGTG